MRLSFRQDSLGNECGTFWVYDLDDLEDTTADGVATPADFDASHWKYQQDVTILLFNLEEAEDGRSRSEKNIEDLRIFNFFNLTSAVQSATHVIWLIFAAGHRVHSHLLLC